MICPFCGKQTFAVKRDDTIGKCFHPNCGRYVTAAQFADTYQNSLSNILEALFYDCHKALLDLPQAHYDHHAWDYLTKESRIHPQVIQDAMLGVIPAGGIDLEARFKPLLEELEEIVKSQAERSTTAEGKSRKKKGRSKQSSSPDASSYLQFISERMFQAIFHITYQLN